jgi:hypothetical protein
MLQEIKLVHYSIDASSLGGGDPCHIIRQLFVSKNCSEGKAAVATSKTLMYHEGG